MRENPAAPVDGLMRIHSPEFTAMHERVLQVTELTSRLNVLPFDDKAGKAALFEQILGRPLPPRVTISPPFYTDHGLHLTGEPIDLAEHVWIGAGAMILPGVRIGHDSLIAAGTVVPDDVPAGSLITGPKGSVRRQW